MTRSKPYARRHQQFTSEAIRRMITACPACRRRGNFRRVDVGGRVIKVCHWCRHEWGAKEAEKC